MKNVLVGISGGVDSSVCALILKNNGYNIIGSTMYLFDDSNLLDAKKTCEMLKIEHRVIDYRDEFKKEVIDYFVNEYKNCHTPNPCVMCNKKLKFGLMYDYAKENNIDYIATGHYAIVEYSNKYDRYILKKAKNKLKDQSYFLYGIDKKMLGNIIFPLGDFESKDEVRSIAFDNNLNTASLSDSEDICFIKDGNYKRFLEDNNYVKTSVGNVVINNKIIGKHSGLYKYTIGQRKGLGIAYTSPLYVIGFDKENNNLLVGTENDLYTNSFKVKDYNLLLVDEIKDKMLVNVKTRYRSHEVEAYIKEVGEYIEVELLNPQKGVTPGQSAVFYIDDIVLGGGVIV